MLRDIRKAIVTVCVAVVAAIAVCDGKPDEKKPEPPNVPMVAFYSERNSRDFDGALDVVGNYVKRSGDFMFGSLKVNGATNSHLQLMTSANRLCFAEGGACSDVGTTMYYTGSSINITWAGQARLALSHSNGSVTWAPSASFSVATVGITDSAAATGAFIASGTGWYESAGDTAANIATRVPTAGSGALIYDDTNTCWRQYINGGWVAGCLGASVTTETVPAAPATGTTSFYFMVDAGYPSIPATIDSQFGIMIPTGTLGAFFTMDTATSNWYVRCARASGWGTTTVQYYQHPTVGTTGSVTGVNWATTDIRTRNIMIGYTGTGAANQSAGPRSGIETSWRGINAGEGGFVYAARFTLNDTAAGHRTAHGLFDSTAALTATADPNAATDSIYIGCNAGDSNLSICSNDNASTATCATLGASFPCTTDNATYDLWLAQKPGAQPISYFVRRLDSAAETAGLVTADLPRTSVQLSWQHWHNSAASGAAVQLNWAFSCIADNL